VRRERHVAAVFHLSVNSSASATASKSVHQSSLAALTLGALGVVYGDIGTSVLYALKEVFATGLIAFTPDNVLGILSLFVWTLTSIVSFKYVTLVLRADNHGEGGLVAMLALASQAVKDKPQLRRVLLLIGIFGTALFYGDGVITPAISVLSAVEGLRVFSPALSHWVIPLTLVILFVLFWVQRYGTSGIGRFFGPLTAIWFIVIAVLGIMNIWLNPAVLWALSPHHAWRFVLENPGVSFLILGALVLCVTGAEALYADLGHFGKKPIRLAWFVMVMPALTCNYLGQGALLLREPAALENPFFLMAPTWAVLPLIGLATLATVIASQALISGAFSVTKQVVQLGYLPRLNILHTSAKDLGQIYIPMVNWGLFVAIVLAVMLFQSSANLASAYGIAVTLDMLITTILTFFVIRFGWRYPLWLCVGATAGFFVIDVLFFASNALKFFEGGWFPLLIGTAIFILMVTWARGRELLTARQVEEGMDLPSFLNAVFVSPPQQVEGTAVFMTPQVGTVPTALLHNLKHNKVLHAQNIFVSVHHHEIPWVGMADRLRLEALGHDCWQVELNFGFKNEPDVPKALSVITGLGYPLDPMATSYFLSRDTVIPSMNGGMAYWREKLFSQMHRNASGAADFLNLPNNAVVELGSKVAL
jgi:KUP system potassium uptake protein